MLLALTPDLVSATALPATALPPTALPGLPSWVAPALVLLSALLASLGAAFVWSRRSGRASLALVAVLLSLGVWDLFYGAELLATTSSWRLALGDVKYLGIGALTPAWIAFTLCWTGREGRVSRRLLAALSVEPALLMVLLADPHTHDLVRSLPAGAPDPLTAEVLTGPLFWVHALYSYALLLPVTALFVASLVRVSRAYWLQAGTLAVASLLPWATNLLFSLSVGWFGHLDLTPVAFTGTGLVLVWGLFRSRLLRLAPRARTVLVDQMADGVVVLDAYGRVSDANPAARAVLAAGADLVGVVAEQALAPEVLTGGQVTLPVGGEDRVYEVTSTALPGTGSAAGRLLVLRDVTDRVRLELQLRALLAEQADVTAQLSSSLRPAALPQVPGAALAARFHPASGEGVSGVGGDFYDVVAVDGGWAFSLGDVSGKGPRAAAVTAHARYALRTLALAGEQPAAALRALHAQLAPGLDDETYLTVVHGRFTPEADGVAVTLALGGHPQPLVVARDGCVCAVGVPGTAIGLLDEAEVREVQLRLDPGSALVLFTDGVSEARDGAALFAETGLVPTLRSLAGRDADAVAEGLVRRVQQLDDGPSGGRDDVAVLVLQAPLHVAVPAGAVSSPARPATPSPRTAP